MSTANQQSTEVELSGAKAWINLWKAEHDSPSPMGELRKDRWYHFMCYPLGTTQEQRRMLSDKLTVPDQGFRNLADAQAAFSRAVQKLKAAWTGWETGFRGIA